jgi:hypothetical protein
MCFDVKNECIRNFFFKCHMKDFWLGTQKEYNFGEFVLDVNFLEYFNYQPT